MSEQHKRPAAKLVAPMETTPWADEFTARLAAKFGSAIVDFASYRQQEFFVASPGSVAAILAYLKSVEGFDYLIDITAVDYPERAERFDVIYFLYSYEHNRRVRVKIQISDGHPPASATEVYRAANWLEREVFDMFGIRFAGHPDLRRILLPEEWTGHPLRKDYSITGMDNRWVRENLGIESGQ